MRQKVQQMRQAQGKGRYHPKKVNSNPLSTNEYAEGFGLSVTGEVIEPAFSMGSTEQMDIASNEAKA